MRNLKNRVLLVVLSVLVVGAVYVQRTGAKEGNMTLTALDYVEIQNLYSKYNHYVDSGKDEGRAYANLFTKDGVFYINLQSKRVARGFAELAAVAKGAGSPPPTIKAAHHAVNLMIEPTPDGAIGSAYLLMVSSPTEGTTTTGLSAKYTDQLVKTPEGWKFKVRQVDLVTPRKPAGAAN